MAKVERKVGEIWKDGSKWKIRAPRGVHTERTKKRCEAWRRQMVISGLIKE